LDSGALVKALRQQRESLHQNQIVRHEPPVRIQISRAHRGMVGVIAIRQRVDDARVQKDRRAHAAFP